MSMAARDILSFDDLRARRLLTLLMQPAIAVVFGYALIRRPFLAAGSVILSLLTLVVIESPTTLAFGFVALLPILQTFGTQITVFGAGGELSLNLMGATNLLVLGIGSLALVRFHHRISWRPLAPVLGLVGYLLLTVSFSPEPLLSLRNWIAYAVPAMIALLLSTDPDPNRLVGRGFTILMVCAGISSILGLRQLAAWDLTYQFNGMPRIPGGHGYPNGLAMFLVLCILAVLLYSTWSTAVGSGMFTIAGLGTLLLLLVFTFSRTGWIALMVCLLIGWVMLGKRLAWTLLLCSFGLGLISNYLLPIVVARFQPDSAYDMRFTLIRIGLDLFWDAPLLGHGVGTFQVMSRDFLGTIVERYGVPLGLVPHNDIIRFLVEGGMVGLLAYAVLVVQGLRLGTRLFRSSEAINRSFGTFLVSATAGTVVFGLAGQGFAFSAPYLLAAMGIAAALRRSDRGPGA